MTPAASSSRALKADLLLLTTACIWGLAFVAQRVGMEHVGPFLFNGVRFALGAVALLPLAVAVKTRAAPGLSHAGSRALPWWGMLAAGTALTLGASLQQIGLQDTTAGKAGFITGLYVILVPFFGAFVGRRTPVGTWAGAAMAVAGMYFLCITEDFTISPGDLLELIGAVFWAGHVLIAAWFAPRMNPLRLAVGQYAVCSVTSLIIALCMENVEWSGIRAAAVPIAYGGLLSVGLAYTLQLVAQRDAPPSHAAIILSLEAVFAALAGWLLLSETLALRGLAGCALMMGGMLLSELWPWLRAWPGRRMARQA